MAFFSMQSPLLQQQQSWGVGNWPHEAITAAAGSMPSIFQALRSSFEAGNTQQQFPNLDDAIQKQLCATSLLQQTLLVLSKKMDYLETGVGFDRMMDPNPTSAVSAAAPPPLPGFGGGSSSSSHGPTPSPPTANAFTSLANSGGGQPQFDCSQWFPLSLTLADATTTAGLTEFSPPRTSALTAATPQPLEPFLPSRAEKVSSCEKFSIPHLLGYSPPPPPPVEEVVPATTSTGRSARSAGARSYGRRLGLLRHQEHCARQKLRAKVDVSGDCPLDMTCSGASPTQRCQEMEVADTTTEGDLAAAFSSARVADRQYTCHICAKVYFSMSALKMHIRTHTLPCKCTVCGKAFSRMWLLNGHLRTHTGEKPFACRVCQRAFADRSNLRAHMQTHSEEKKYRCEDCGKTFSRMGLLTKHRLAACGNSNIDCAASEKTRSSDLALATTANSTNSSSAEETELLSRPPAPTLSDKPDHPDAPMDFWTATLFEQTCTETHK